jgi:hypothetical protein
MTERERVPDAKRCTVMYRRKYRCSLRVGHEGTHEAYFADQRPNISEVIDLYQQVRSDENNRDWPARLAAAMQTDNEAAKQRLVTEGRWGKWRDKQPAKSSKSHHQEHPGAWIPMGHPTLEVLDDPDPQLVTWEDQIDPPKLAWEDRLPHEHRILDPLDAS